jgi:hypothetical protein
MGFELDGVQSIPTTRQKQIPCHKRKMQFILLFFNGKIMHLSRFSPQLM